MEEDDMDFNPSTKTSSNLATLFGFTKKPLKGNSSLTYTAPKAPKREASPAKKQSEEKTKGKIIFSNAVQAYKLENRTYVNQGLIGIVISGNHDFHSYEIILYKRTKEHLNQIKISSSFSITLSLNNYVSFYDNNKQNWSVMFQSSADVEQFSQKVAICKFYSHSEPPTDILIQDLGPASQKKAFQNSTVEIVYNSYTLIPEELTKLRSDIKEKIKLSNCDNTYLSKGLIGCAENCKRIIIIPYALSGPWLNELCTNKDILIEVKIEKIITKENSVFESKLPGNGPPESPIDSSAEETSIIARGASIRETLSTAKSQKANLISRMARMGQATLPLKQELSAGPSDSEEEVSVTSTPKPRLPRNRNTVANSSMNNLVSQFQNSEASHQLSVYQNDLSWERTQLDKLGVTYQQLIPVSASPITSPSADSNLSVYASESRIQAAELRMGISKISEKLDLVWNKIQNMNVTGIENKAHHQALVDSGGILSSIQNLFTENESLKKKIEEQKEKIEQQNDRIYHLLELNHKYLEQNSTTQEKQSANELVLKAEVESLQRKELEMEAANKTALDRVKNLEEDLAKSDELNKELKEKMESLKVEAEDLKRVIEKSNENEKESESLKEKILKASETIIKLREKIREVVSENQNLKSVIKAQKEKIEMGSQEMKDSRTKNQEYEKAVESLKKLISEEESKTESKIDNLSKLVARLEGENKSLMERIEVEKDAFVSEKEDDLTRVKNVLQTISSALKDQFSGTKEYSSSHVLAAVEKIFSNVVNENFKLDIRTIGSPETEPFAVEPTSVPTSGTSLHNSEPLHKEKEEEEEKESTKSEKKEKNSSTESENKEEKSEIEDLKTKDEVDSRYKSYDQGWRTAKPPPPPLFDDEDEDDDWLN